MAVSHKEVSRKYGLTPSEREMKNSMWMVRYLHRVFLLHFLRFFSIRRMRSCPTGGRFRGNGAFRLQAFLRICLKGSIYKNGKHVPVGIGCRFVKYTEK